ncbi:10540_t:CDS:2 [Cetraspora pellucida]|uniref:10540_t:CDS:1 n=1 Tax=Cetraspora pellucida TaxID=1433469 RepID=A0A9N9HR30_9GLOM|nr:10540_t:CDS:2 [Cetraspora pellucida]
MCESVLYKCEKLDINHALEGQLDLNENELINSQKAKNIEDFYDYWQTCLKELLKLVSKEQLKKSGKLFHTWHQIFICHYYFKLMMENVNALFYIMLMPTRWLHNDAWRCIDSIYDEPFIGTSSLQHQGDNNIQKLIPRHYYNVQEIQVRNYLQKKMDYGHLIGHFKKALSYSMEDNDQNVLNKLILNYITKKEEVRNV